MSNFYKPTTKEFLLIELLTFYGLCLKITNFEQQLPIYQLCKVSDSQKGKILSMLGFNIEKVIIPATTNFEEMSAEIKNHISKEFKDAREIRKGIYQISM